MSIGFVMNFYNLSIIEIMEFSDWITKKFIEWRGNKIGNSGSISEFAKQFNASHQIVSEWMKKDGKVPTSSKYINALVDMYGVEVYEVLGLTVPGLPPENSDLLLSATSELTKIAKERDLDPEDPAFVELFVEVFSRYGINVQRTD